MARLISGHAGSSLDLPGGLRLAVGYADAVVSAGGDEACPLPELEGEHAFAVPGETVVGGWCISVAVHERSLAAPDGSGDDRPDYAPDGLTARLDHGALGGRSCFRARRPGDRFQPLGMSKSKKLQDFMVDSKIPRQWRDSVPLVASDNGIAWVVGWRIADWARVQDQRGPVLELRLTPGTAT